MQETQTETNLERDKWYSPLTRVTPLSKYLSLALFIILPFVGFWLGVGYGEKVMQSSVVNVPTHYDSARDVRDDTQNNPDEVSQGDDYILYRMHASWGPCAGPEGSCWEEVTLSSAGLYQGVNYRSTTTYTLGATVIDEFKRIVQANDLLSKQCEAPMVLDAHKTYYLHGRADPITFPGCEDEMRQLEQLIQTRLDEVMNGVMPDGWTWQTYNSKLGFSIQYPSVWTMRFPEDDELVFEGGNSRGLEGMAFIHVTQTADRIPPGMSIEEMYSERMAQEGYSSPAESREVFIVNGHTAVRITLIHIGTEVVTYIQNGNDVIEVAYNASYAPAFNEIYEEMIRSLQFSPNTP